MVGKKYIKIESKEKDINMVRKVEKFNRFMNLVEYYGNCKEKNKEFQLELASAILKMNNLEYNAFKELIEKNILLEKRVKELQELLSKRSVKEKEEIESSIKIEIPNFPKKHISEIIKGRESKLIKVLKSFDGSIDGIKKLSKELRGKEI